MKHNNSFIYGPIWACLNVVLRTAEKLGLNLFDDMQKLDPIAERTIKKMFPWLAMEKVERQAIFYTRLQDAEAYCKQKAMHSVVWEARLHALVSIRVSMPNEVKSNHNDYAKQQVVLGQMDTDERANRTRTLRQLATNHA